MTILKIKKFKSFKQKIGLFFLALFYLIGSRMILQVRHHVQEGRVEDWHNNLEVHNKVS